MDEDRRRRLYEVVARRDGAPRPFGRLQAVCGACVEVLAVGGAGVMLAAEGSYQATVYATEGRILRLENLQNVVGEGPGIDAAMLARPVLEPDLAGAGRRAWPLLADAALQAGLGAWFSFPLRLEGTVSLDASTVGALNLYRDHPGPLEPRQVEDARLLAAMATREVLTMQAEAAPGQLPAQLGDLPGDRVSVEQATGMVSVQINGTIAEGAGRLRAYAKEHGRALVDVARDVVARRLRLV